jgi:hypothetical protein
MRSALKPSWKRSKTRAGRSLEVETAIEKALTYPRTPQEETLVDVYADIRIRCRSAVTIRTRQAEKEPAEARQDHADAGGGARCQELLPWKLIRVYSCWARISVIRQAGYLRTSKGLQDRFGKERVRPTPIAETAIIGAGIGAALVGMRPIAEIMFNDFSRRLP